MDRFARELVTTGYLHNHVRMWWASFWIHVERLPWELGADFFDRHLLDSDPASNTLSWRWVAGLQTPGKTYLVRRSNLEKYADPAWLADDAGLTRLDDSRVAAADVEEFADTRSQALAPLPETPPSSGRRTGLWLHADDRSVEQSSLRTLQNPALLGFNPEPDSDPDQSGPIPRAWRAAAQADAWSRGLAQFEPRTSKLCSDPGDLGETLVKMAGELGVERLVAVAPTVGRLADQVPSACRRLEASGVDLVLVRRPWDARLWPLARRGFFDFWQRVQVDLRRGKPVTEQSLLPGLV
jgi:deoxyribodipyrimidine photo-lyase